MKEIDCRGLSYLKIIREIKKYFNSIGEGEAIIRVDSELGHSNVMRYAIHKGYRIDTENDENRFEIKVEKRGCLEAEEEENIFSILVTSDKLGIGDEKIGNLLMQEYFEALNEYDELPKSILFLNSGVKLFDDNYTAEQLKMLYKKGVAILINDSSLEYYKLKENIDFGEIVNIYDMVVTMKKAKKLIRL